VEGSNRKLQKNCIIRSIKILLLANYLGDEIKEYDVGRPCGVHWGEVHTGVWWVNLSEGDCLKQRGTERGL